MRNVLSGLAAASLLAAAFFLPDALAQWGDRRLLDEPHITRQDQEREGFAESVQLSVAEKLFLLRSSSVTSVALKDVEIVYWEDAAVKDAVLALEPAAYLKEDPDATHEAEEAAKKWEQRRKRVQNELWGLQTAGALPYLWNNEEKVEYSGTGQTLYIDQESQVSFLAYHMTLSCAPYSINVMVDAKTERILGFRLNWSKGSPPSWGYRGCSRFGAAWRDYWGMDSVNSAWDSEYIRSILEMPGEEVTRNGSYNSNAEISFAYDTQTLRVPLANWVYSSSDGMLGWNIL